MLLNTLFKHWSYKIFAPGTIIRKKYEAFKRLLRYDGRCHEQMAEFQDLLHGERREDLTRIRKRFSLFSTQVAGMVSCLDIMAPGKYASLKEYHKKFDFYACFLLAPPSIDLTPPFVLSLSQIDPENTNIGNKATNLAILKNEIDVPVPDGFAITANGFHYLVEYNNLRKEIDDFLSEIHIESSHSLNWISARLMERIENAKMPPAIEQAMLTAFDALKTTTDKPMRVAVRSSAITEDGECSFAGQYTTLLGVSREKLCTSYLKVLASKYCAEALFYRINHGLGDEETAMSVLVLEMVEAESSGVLYTRAPMRNTEDGEENSNNNDHLHLHVIRGLGEALVGGAAVPDQYITNRNQPPEIRHIMALNPDKPILTAEQVSSICAWGIAIENHFDTPQDIEWAIADNRLLFLQARPLHVSCVSPAMPEDFKNHAEEDLLVVIKDCEGASGGITAGKVYHLDPRQKHGLDNVPAGAVLVCRDTPPDYVQIIHRLAAVIAERGSRASHFATVAREFGMPFLAGVGEKVNLLEAGSTVTVNGYQGVVYQGKIESMTTSGGRAMENTQYHRILRQVLKFITPLELTDPAGENFRPEGCRSLHDIIRFCHEKSLQAMFSAARPGTGRGALKLVADLPLDVFLFDVGGGFAGEKQHDTDTVPLADISSIPFQSLWHGLSHPGVQWKKKAFDWDAYDKIELAGGIAPSKDSFDFASYAIIGADYLHFNIRFGYHFTIVDVLCGENSQDNYCMMRFAGGGGDFDSRSLRIDFITQILEQLAFTVEQKGDMLEARLSALASSIMKEKLDMLGRLLGATKLMDMVLTGDEMVRQCVDDFFRGRYSFSQEG